MSEPEAARHTAQVPTAAIFPAAAGLRACGPRRPGLLVPAQARRGGGACQDRHQVSQLLAYVRLCRRHMALRLPVVQLALRDESSHTPSAFMR